MPISSEAREAFLFVLFALALAVLWYFLYIRPNDEFLGAVMDCMGTDSSRAAYDRCVTLLRQ